MARPRRTKSPTPYHETARRPGVEPLEQLQVIGTAMTHFFGLSPVGAVEQFLPHLTGLVSVLPVGAAQADPRPDRPSRAASAGGLLFGLWTGPRVTGAVSPHPVASVAPEARAVGAADTLSATLQGGPWAARGGARPESGAGFSAPASVNSPGDRGAADGGGLSPAAGGPTRAGGSSLPGERRTPGPDPVEYGLAGTLSRHGIPASASGGSAPRAVPGAPSFSPLGTGAPAPSVLGGSGAESAGGAGPSSPATPARFDPFSPSGDICNFASSLPQWTFAESGGSLTGRGSVAADGDGAVLREGDSFAVTLTRSFVVPAAPPPLSLTYHSIDFDTSAPAAVNDAFEVALVDAQGVNLVHPFRPSRDAYVNFTEGLPAAFGAEASQTGQTVRLDLSGIFPGTEATLVLRLVNNDGDTGTAVRLCGVDMPDSAPAVALGLVNDTAPPGSAGDPYRTDLLTNDPRVAGTASDDLGVVKLEAAVDGGPLLDITPSLANGRFQFDPGSLAPGAHRVTVRATDTTFHAAEASLDFRVNRPPTADAGGDRTVDAGATVTFDGRASSDPEAPLFAYRWAFHDGTTADGPTVTKAYPQPGTYPVTLTVTDTAGSTTQATVSVTARDALRTLNPAATKDDGEWAYRERGLWQGGPAGRGWKGDYRFQTRGTGVRTATWTLSVAGGTYEVFASWPALPSNASNAPYTITDGRAVRGTVRRDQRQVPNDGRFDGLTWRSLGVYRFDSGIANVELSDSADGNVVADGVLLVSASPLLAAGGPLSQLASGAQLTADQLHPFVAEAARRWSTALNDPSLATTLAAVDVRVADLNDAYLGITSGATVVLDADAAGYGWFLDPTPADNAEFVGSMGGDRLDAATGPAAGGVDLLSVLTHELGHVLGRGDADEGASPHDVMVDSLPAGVRRLPAAAQPPIRPKFYVVDASGAAFSYGPHGEAVGSFSLAAPAAKPRGVASDAAGTTLWILDESGHEVSVRRPNGTVIGAWSADGLQDPVGIALAGEDLWVVDAATKTVLRYARAAERSAGTLLPEAAFSLHPDNSRPSDLTTDGARVWVTDERRAEVFVYDVAGRVLARWRLDPANEDPSGITRAPSGGSDLWVLDREDRLVYHYAGGTTAQVGSIAATATFALAPGNLFPEAIVDPDGSFQIGDVVASSIITPGGADVWTFAATAGQRVFFDTQGGTVASFLTWTLTAPDGASLFQESFRDHDVTVLGTTGQYTLTLQAATGRTGTYQFQLFDVPAPDPVPIDVGDLVSGSISIPGEEDHYTFVGVAGQRLFFDVQQAGTSTVPLGFQILKPDGTLLFANSRSDRDVFVLADAGTYRVIVGDISNVLDATGSYRFKVWEVPAPATVPFNIGDVVSGTIDIPGEEDHYTFAGSAGQRLFFDVQQAGTSTVPLGFQILKPDGTTLFANSRSDRDVFVLADAGTYRVIVGDISNVLDATGSYRFKIWQVPPILPTPIQFAQVVSGDLAIPGEEAHYTFTALAGQQLYFDARRSGTTTQRLAFEILLPNGISLFPRDDDDRGPFLAPISGTYTVAVGELFSTQLDAVGSYQFAVFDVLQPPAGVGNLDTKGTEFWLAFPGGYHELFPKPGEVSLLIAAEQETRGQVYMPGLGTFEQFVARPGAVTTLTFPTSVTTTDPELRATDGVENKGIRVTAEKEITVYGMNHVEASTDAYLGLPLDALGTDYLVLAYKNVRPPNDIRAGVLGTQLAVVASADNTQITITPSVKAGNRAAGVPFNITLNKGQTYQLRSTEAAPADLTGTVITSTAPVGVYGGHHAANIPFLTPAADYLVEQLPPVDGWGKRFVAMPLATRTGGDTFRFLAQADGTEVRANGSLIATLNRGQVYETILTTSAEIIATKPILVGQYQHSSAFDGATGDPDMIVVPPYEQFLANYTVATPTNDVFQANYIDVFVPSAGVGLTTLDGVAIASSQFHRIGASDFWGAQIPVSRATHQLAGPVPFGTVVYGFASFDSYGYPGGTNSAPVARISQISLSPGEAVLTAGLVHEVDAFVSDGLGNPLRGVRVDFRVSGSNPGSSFSFTDAAGRAVLRYTGANAGSDTIVASSGDAQAAGRANWTAAAPIQLSILSPLDGEAIDAPGVALVTGRAVAGRPVLPSGQVFPNRISHVLINGVPVDTLDSVGNFFTRVPIRPGQLRFEVTAFDLVGQTATSVLTLEGLQRTAGVPQFDLLSDVTASFAAEYERTSFFERAKTLSADWEIRNVGQYPTDAPLLVGVTNVSNPRVQVRGADGTTPDGVPYYDFSGQVLGGSLEPGQHTGTLTLQFFNPERVPFTYDLVFFGGLNVPPQFTTVPVVETTAGRRYAYDAEATDPNGETVRFSLAYGPTAMSVDAATGMVTWSPGTNDIGSHPVSVRAADPRGAFTEQRYVVTVLAPPPNRPPVFTSAPVVEANVGTPYAYRATAADADGDALRFAVVDGPTGLAVDPDTGLTAWTPSAGQLGNHIITLEVSDGRGGSSRQSYTVCVSPRAGNRAPIIVSSPVTTAIEGVAYSYVAAALDADGDALAYDLLAAPAGMQIDPSTGQVAWTPSSTQVGPHTVSVLVRDGRGGSDVQTFTLAAAANVGEIRGAKFHDVNGNGKWDANFLGGRQPDVVFVIDLSGTALTLFDGVPVGDQNGDRLLNTTVDAQIAAAVAINQQLIDSGLGAVADIAVVRDVLTSGGNVDMDPVAPGIQLSAHPLADANNNGQPDVVEALRSLRHVATTADTKTALARAAGNLTTLGTAPEDGNVLLFSRGNIGNADLAPESAALHAKADRVRAFALAHSSNIFPLRVVDPSAAYYLNVTQFLGAFGGFNGATFQQAEPAVPGWTVYLDLDNDGNSDAGEPTRITDQNGSYAFTNLTPGTYVVREQVEAGWAQTSPAGTGAATGDGLGDAVLGFFDSGTGPLPGPYGRYAGKTSSTPEPVETQIVLGPLSPSPRIGVNAATRFITLPTDSSITIGFTDETVIDGPGNDIFIGTLQLAPFGGGSAGETADVYVSSNLTDFTFLGTVLEDFLPGLDLASIGYAQPVRAVRIVGKDLLGSFPGFEFVGVQIAPTSIGPAVSDGAHVVTVGSRQVIDGRDFGNRRLRPDDPNGSPTFTSTAPAAAEVGALYAHTVTATDPDHDTLTFDLPVAPAGMAIHPTLGRLVWIPEEGQVGTFDVVLRARDGKGGIALQPFQVTVGPANAAPAFTSEPPPGPAGIGLPFVYAARASDANGDPLGYRLEGALPGMAIDSRTGSFRWTPAVGQSGAVAVVLVAEDGRGGQGRQTLRLRVDANPANASPVIASTPRTRTWLGHPYAYPVEASDANGDPLAFSLVHPPEGMAVGPDGMIRWEPTSGQIGTHAVVVEVRDGRGGLATQRFDVEVTATPKNRPPVVTSVPILGATVGQPYRLALTASDPDGDPVRWSLDRAPAGMAVDATTGVVTWTPSAGQLGGRDVVVRAEDPYSAAAAQSFTVVVHCVNQPPSITSTPTTQASVAELFTYAVRADDPEGDALTFRLLAGPQGLRIDPATGLVLWTPSAAQVGPQIVAIEADDGNGNVATQRFTLDVTAAPANLPPVITSTPPTVATVDRLYAYTLTAADPEFESVTFGFFPSVPPPVGMTIDSASGRLEWTPNLAQVGPHVVALTATDARGARSYQTFTVDVQVNLPPAITSLPVTTVTAGAEYRYDVHAVDPNGDPLTYRVTGPAGMTVDALGRVRWSTGQAAAHSYPVVITVEDRRGASAAQSFDVLVTPDIEAPRVSVQASASVVDLGAVVVFQVLATDNVSVVGRTLTVGGVNVALDDQGQASVAMNLVGFMTAEGTAVDAVGNVGRATTQVRVIDRNDPRTPTIRILSPANGGTVGYLTPIVGDVEVPAGQTLDYYKVEVARADLIDTNNVGADDPDWREIGRGTSPVANGTLAVFDPTTLLNDQYVVRVVAFNTNGLGRVESVAVNTSGEAKLGEFRLEFTDLAIPVAGIPITVGRVYDTRRANDSGDFGFGWTLALQDADIRETVPQTPQGFFTTGAPFRYGTRVYLTNPEGRRVGFTFEPENRPNAFFANVWVPKFRADPGVYDALSVSSINLTQKADGTFAAFLLGFPYNPDAYTLTTKDQLRYEYDQFKGLQKVTDPNGNVLTFRDDGIFSSTGEAVRFQRDLRDRISAVVDPAGNLIVYRYDARHDLASVTNQENLTTTFTYRTDRKHYLDEVRDPLGHRPVKTEYGPDGRVVAVTDALGNRSEQNYDPAQFTGETRDALGNVTRFTYNDRGNVLRSQDPEGNVTLYEYGDPQNPDRETKVTDPRGFATNYTFDVRGNATGVTDPYGNTWRATYNAMNQVVTTVDPLGRTTSSVYDPKGNLTLFINAEGSRSTQTFDAQGRRISSTDNNGHTTAYVYGTGSSPTGITNPDGTARSLAYNGFGLPTLIVDERGKQLAVTYDRSGRPLTVRDPEGGVTRNAYQGTLLVSQTDPLGHTTRYEYDAANRRVRQVDALGGVTEFAYDATDNLISTTDPLGRSTSNTYRRDGRLQTTVDALGGVTRFEYDPAGNRSAVIDPLGRRRAFAYDPVNRLVLETDPLGGTTSRTFDALGNLTSLTDALGNTTRSQYDALNRLVLETDALGGVTRREYDASGNVIAQTDPLGHTTRSDYDARGRLIRQTDPLGFRVTIGYDEAGNQVATTDQLGHTTTFTYDGLGRRLTTTDVAGGTTANAYDLAGNLVSTTDPLGRTTRYQHDALNRVVAVIDPLSGVVRSAYDAVGNRISLTDPVGNTTRFDFDALDRLVLQTDPFGRVTSSRYDAVGNRVEVIDRNDRRRTFDFDALDRPVRETWWDGASALRVITSAYDAVGNLVAASDPDSSYAFAYDALGRLVTTDNAGTPQLPRVVLTSTYDGVGNRVEVRDNTGVTVRSAYDPRGLLTSRTWQGGGVSPARIDFLYDARQDNVATTRFSDLQGTQKVGSRVASFDALGRVARLTHRDAVDALMADYQYAYDGASQLSREIRNGETITYGYDPLSQLTDAVRAVGPDEHYVYDANGNRTGGGYVVGPNNQLLADGTFRYEYDAEGNQVRKTEIATGKVTTYGFDYRNRLTSVVEHSAGGLILSEVRYVYDVQDRLIARVANGQALFTVYDGPSAWADFDGSGAVVVRYLHGDRIDEILARHRPVQGTAWYLSDKLGTVRDLAGAAGVVINHLDYDSFGNILLQSNPSAGDRFTFTGREHEAQLPLLFFRARFYDPASGRFVAEDPLGHSAGDPNLYRYVNNAVTNATDPTGTVEALEYTHLAALIALPVLYVLTQYAVYNLQKHTQSADYSTVGEGNSPFGVWFEGTTYSIAVTLLHSAAGDRGEEDERTTRIVGHFVVAQVTTRSECDPPLVPIHGLDEYYLTKYRSWSTEDLIDSLRPYTTNALRTRPDGTILNGHHRTAVLRERGIDVDCLPREVIPRDNSFFYDIT